MKKTGKTIIIIIRLKALLLGERLFVMAHDLAGSTANMTFAEWGLKRSLRDIKQELQFAEVREEILAMIWNMEEGHGRC